MIKIHQNVSTDSALFSEVSRLRYEVYVLDKRYEPRNTVQLERDVWDETSMHTLIIDGKTPVATTRLIFPAQNTKGCPLPIDEISEDHRLAMWNREELAEVSRFIVSGAARKERRALLVLLLIQSLVVNSREWGVKYWVAVMSNSLFRMLARLGIHFTRMGAMIEHMGQRQPCYVELDSMLNRCKAERRDVWEVISRNKEQI